ncbi:MAG: AAA family ATPase [Gammaproteobacteria bacterium]|jgi:chromosome partitioning protein
MRVLASYNIKGGVGKTASAVNLSYLAAQGGARTLVWDLDPQGAASFYFRIKARVKGGGGKLVKGKKDLDKLIKGTNYENLDLLPADFSYRHMDLELEDARKPGRRLHKLLKPLADEYDYVFLDCPPSISLVSESVFEAADVLLVPTIPTILSLRTYDQLQRFLEQSAQTTTMPFFTMVDRRKQLHRMIVDQPPATMSGLLRTWIPYASEVERMGLERAALGAFARRSRAALAYTALWEEIRSRLGA